MHQLLTKQDIFHGCWVLFSLFAVCNSLEHRCVCGTAVKPCKRCPGTLVCASCVGQEAQDAMAAEMWRGDAQWATRDGRKAFCLMLERRMLPKMCALPQLGVWCSVSLAAWCKTLSSQDLKILTLNVCLIWAVSVTSELVTRIWNEFFTPVRHRSELQTPHGSSTVTCRFFECWPRNSTGTCSKCQANNTLLSAGVQLWHPLSLSHECKFLCRVDFQILSRANLGVFILPLFFCFPWCSCAQS